MKTLLKVLLYIGLVLIILFVLAISAVFYLFNPNDYKPQIETAMYAATGRSFTINGDISWSLFPRFGFTANDITMGNPTGFSDPTFMHLDSAHLSIAVLPLLSKNIQADSLLVNGLELNLVKKDLSHNNWTFAPEKQLESSSPNNTAQTQPSTGERFTLNISKFAIENATLNYSDLSTHQHYSINHFNFKGTDIAIDKAFPVHLSFAWQSSEPKMQGEVTIDTRLDINDTYQTVLLSNLRLSSNTTINKETGIIPLNIVIVGEAKLHPYAGSLIGQWTLALNNAMLANCRFNLEHLYTSLQYHGDISVPNFNLNKLLANLKISKSSIANPSMLDEVNLNTNIVGNTQSIAINNLVANLGASNLKGDAKFDNLSAPNISLDFNINQISLNDYIKLYGAEFPLSGIHLQANLNANGWASSELANSLNGQINMSVQQATLKGLDIQAQLNALSNAIKGVIHGQNFQAALDELKSQLPDASSNQWINPNNGKVTQFSAFTSQTTAKNGILNNNLALSGQQFHIQGQGVIDLNKNAQINYHLNAYSLSDSSQSDSSQMLLPIKITGTPQNLKYGVDMYELQKELRELLVRQVEQTVKSGVQGLGGLLQQVLPNPNSSS